MTLKSVLAAAFACFLWTVPAVASAQFSPMLYNGPSISLQSHANRYSNSGGGSSAATTRSAPRSSANQNLNADDSGTPVNLAALRYRPDMARRRANLAQFVSKTRQVDPAGATQLEQVFAQHDVLDGLQRDLTKFGLSIDNVGDAYATYWISAYQATRGDTNTPSKGTFSAVKAQAARALARTPEFQNATEANKQEMAEALLVQAIMLDAAIQGSSGNPGQMNQVSAAAAQGARGMGLNLSKMKLTETGFVPTDETGE